MATDNFSEEEWLNKYYNHKISALEFITAAPKELQEHYSAFCADNDLQQFDIEAARNFIDWYYYDTEQEEPIVAEDDSDYETAIESDNTGKVRTEFTDQEAPLDLFDKWNKDSAFLSELSTSKDAVTVALWRYKNPTEQNIERCAGETGLSVDTVNKWWKVAVWLDGYAGGGHLHFINLTEDSLEDYIFKACFEQMNS